MNGFVHVKGERAEKTRKSFFSMRKSKTKMMLFSQDTIMFIMMVSIAGSIMLLNSYLKAYRNSQNVEIVRTLETKRELILKRNEIKGNFMKMTSSSELMKKAGELDLSVATLDKVMNVE
jgi:cell division septal protein FtsQ